jgi:HK97 family phage major capsid protein
MNLQELLALSRGAANAETRKSLYGTWGAQKRGDAYRLAFNRAKEIRDNPDATAEERADMSHLLDVCDELRGIVAEDDALANRFSVNEAFDNQPAARFFGSTPGTPTGRGSDHGAGAPEGVPAATRTRGERVGTDLVQIGGRAIDHEGFGISERTFNAIRERDYERAFLRNLCGRADQQDRSVLAVGIDVDGGYLAPPQVLNEVVGPDPYPSSLLDAVRTIPTTAGSFMVPKNNYTGSDIYNSPYRKTRTSGVSGASEQSALQFGMIEVPMHESMIEVPIPRAFLEDVGMIRSYAIEMMREAYRLGTEYEIALGTGIGQPEGIMTNSGSTGKVQEYNVGTSPDAVKWMKLFREVPVMYRANAKLMISDAAYQDVETVQTTDGAFPFAVVNLTTSAATNGPTERYRGKPIGFTPFYADYSNGNKVATWGDHSRAYYYGLRLGVTFGIRDIANESYVVLVMRVRDGGALSLTQALRVAKAS